MIEQIVTRLEAVPALSGVNVVPWIRRSNTANSAVSYFLVSSDRELSLSLAPQLISERYQFDCWAKTYAEVKVMADAVLSSLHGFVDRNNGIDLVSLANMQDMFEEDAEVHRVMLEFNITHH